MYHERQKLMHCAMHTLNNLFQERWADRELMERLARELFHREAALRAESGMGKLWVSPYKSVVPGLGDYDVNVMVEALKLRQHCVSLHAVFNAKDPYAFASSVEQAVNADAVEGIVVNFVSSRLMWGQWVKHHFYAIKKIAGIRHAASEAGVNVAAGRTTCATAGDHDCGGISQEGASAAGKDMAVSPTTRRRSPWRCCPRRAASSKRDGSHAASVFDSGGRTTRNSSRNSSRRAEGLTHGISTGDDVGTDEDGGSESSGGNHDTTSDRGKATSALGVSSGKLFALVDLYPARDSDDESEADSTGLRRSPVVRRERRRREEERGGSDGGDAWYSLDSRLSAPKRLGGKKQLLEHLLWEARVHDAHIFVVSGKDDSQTDNGGDDVAPADTPGVTPASVPDSAAPAPAPAPAERI